MKFKTAIVIGFTLIAASCSTALKSNKWNRVSGGMTKAQVLDELGEPRSSSLVNGKETLEYDVQGTYAPVLHWVVLEDGKVTKYGPARELR